MPLLAKFACVSAALLVPAVLSLPAQDASYSIPMDVIHGKPHVMATVNGKGPFRFIVDTGTATGVILSPELADQLNLLRAGEVRLNDPSGQEGQRTDFVLIESLLVGGAQFGWIEAIEHRIPDEDIVCDGILGFGLFRDYLLNLDFPNRRMTFGSGALALDDQKSVLPFRMPNGVPITTVQIGALQVDALIDSGGSGLSLPERLVPQLTLASDPVVFGIEQSLTTQFPVKAAKLAQDVKVGRYTFAQPFVEINPAFPFTNFGASPLENFSVTFDQENLLMRLDSDRSVFHLDAPHTVLHLRNAPVEKPPAPPLVPVG